MYGILQKILEDQKGNIVFRLFDIWHIGYIVFFVAVAVCLGLYLKNKTPDARSRVMDCVIGTVLGLYVLDFFLMPFAYGEIDVKKLPFHVCTTMCIMCFFSRRNAFLGKFRLQFAMLGFLSNLVYLIYPGAMFWYDIHPMSYRVVQTLAFHGIMMVYGLLVLIYERQEFTWKKIYKDLGVVVAMTVWACIGNTLYTNDALYPNWFFTLQDPFNAFPQTSAPYIMPFLNIAVFFGVELVVYLVFWKLRKVNKEICARK